MPSYHGGRPVDDRDGIVVVVPSQHQIDVLHLPSKTLIIRTPHMRESNNNVHILLLTQLPSEEGAYTTEVSVQDLQRACNGRAAGYHHKHYMQITPYIRF